ncbi:MAG TPA: formate dehydrogenase subunit gamma [Kiloniellales bacterium]|nr:formate dehydrogenase subunit gamma [Kiloniellales bacterium]
MITQRILFLHSLLMAAGVGLALLLISPLLQVDHALAQPAPGEAMELPLEDGRVPGGAWGTEASSDMWRAIREGRMGNVQSLDPQAGVMIQSEGDNWRAIRNGPLKTYGAWLLLGMVGLLAIFFLLRGRIRINSGWSGVLVERFSGLDRFAHWLAATTFILLAITGLNVMFGRYLLLPLVGPEAFGAVTLAGKYVHNYLALPFTLGLLLMLVLWIGHNIPNRHDLVWLLKGGGIFSRKAHVPARKFNAGQKILFWAVIIGGFSLTLSGVALMFPFQTGLWASTFGFLGSLGLNVPAAVTPMMEMQLNTLWHGVVGLVMIAIILGHIYIGTIGMEGAFSAMGSGKVDLNWAREHHSIWVEEEEGRSAQPPQGGVEGATAPAE